MTQPTTPPGSAPPSATQPALPPTGVLTSFWYYKRYDFTRIPANVPVIADSGAFSAYMLGKSVDIGEYAEWLTEHAHRFDFAFNLDVIGDAEGSYTQWLDLQRRGHTTMPVIHFGDLPEEALPRYFDGGADRLAISGGALKGVSVQQVLHWQARVHKWLRANHPTIPTHGLGIHMRSRLARLPWTTTDSSAFTGAWRFARLAMWRPQTRRWVTIHLNGSEPYRYGSEIRAYGGDPVVVARSTAATRPALIELVTRIEARAADDWNLRRIERAQTPTQRFLVHSSDKDLDPTTPVLSQRFLVEGSPGNMDSVVPTLSTLATPPVPQEAP